MALPISLVSRAAPMAAGAAGAIVAAEVVPIIIVGTIGIVSIMWAAKKFGFAPYYRNANGSECGLREVREVSL